MSANVVTFTCMTTKEKFEVTNPDVFIMANGRYAYRVECPWKGKEGKTLHAFKFASKAAYEQYVARSAQSSTDADDASESE